MDYALIGKIEKAKIYAEERERIQFDAFNLTIEGDHSDHHVSYEQGEWSCDCDFFNSRGYCSHTMAMERILGNMLPPLAS